MTHDEMMAATYRAERAWRHAHWVRDQHYDDARAPERIAAVAAARAASAAAGQALDEYLATAQAAVQS